MISLYLRDSLCFVDTFEQLMDTCLKSTHLPSYLAAAFAKKLGRLGLSAPPAGALLVIAMIHNLLRRHPSINCLVHRVSLYHVVPKDILGYVSYRCFGFKAGPRLSFWLSERQASYWKSFGEGENWGFLLATVLYFLRRLSARL